ncbi:hypothetical protein FKM82_022650 [Ascaphus truei]
MTTFSFLRKNKSTIFTVMVSQSPKEVPTVSPTNNFLGGPLLFTCACAYCRCDDTHMRFKKVPMRMRLAFHQLCSIYCRSCSANDIAYRRIA